jgi:hypothetical protein
MAQSRIQIQAGSETRLARMIPEIKKMEIQNNGMSWILH